MALAHPETLMEGLQWVPAAFLPESKMEREQPPIGGSYRPRWGFVPFSFP